jgi:hypothetical protein
MIAQREHSMGCLCGSEERAQDAKQKSAQNPPKQDQQPQQREQRTGAASSGNSTHPPRPASSDAASQSVVAPESIPAVAALVELVTPVAAVTSSAGEHDKPGTASAAAASPFERHEKVASVGSSASSAGGIRRSSSGGGGSDATLRSDSFEEPGRNSSGGVASFGKELQLPPRFGETSALAVSTSSQDSALDSGPLRCSSEVELPGVPSAASGSTDILPVPVRSVPARPAAPPIASSESLLVGSSSSSSSGNSNSSNGEGPIWSPVSGIRSLDCSDSDPVQIMSSSNPVPHAVAPDDEGK